MYTMDGHNIIGIMDEVYKTVEKKWMARPASYTGTGLFYTIFIRFLINVQYKNSTVNGFSRAGTG